MPVAMNIDRARQKQVRRKRERANEARRESWEETRDEYGCYGLTPPEVRRKAEKRTEQRMRANLRKEMLEAEAVSIRSRGAEEAERKAAASEIREVCAQEVEAQAKRKAAVAELEEVEAQALLEEKQKKKRAEYAHQSYSICTRLSWKEGRRKPCRRKKGMAEERNVGGGERDERRNRMAEGAGGSESGENGWHKMAGADGCDGRSMEWDGRSGGEEERRGRKSALTRADSR